MTEIVSIRGAARQLGKAHSTISRYVAAYPALNRGTVERPMVDVDEVRRHRGENINPARTGSHAGRLLGQAGGEATAPKKPGDRPDYALAKAVRETVLAQRARVDLDEKRGLLVPRQEVEDAVYDAGALLQRDLLNMAGQVSERIAAMTDKREIETLLETEIRAVLAAMASTLRGQVEAENEARASATGQVVQLDPRPK